MTDNESVETDAFGGPLGREASLKGDERDGKIARDAYRRTGKYRSGYSARN